MVLFYFFRRGTIYVIMTERFKFTKKKKKMTEHFHFLIKLKTLLLKLIERILFGFQSSNKEIDLWLHKAHKDKGLEVPLNDTEKKLKTEDGYRNIKWEKEPPYAILMHGWHRLLNHSHPSLKFKFSRKQIHNFRHNFLIR